MSQNLTIKLKPSEMKKLSGLALRYGLSLPEFTRKILTELEDTFPPDSFTEYDNAEDLKASFGRALVDWRSGRVHSRL